MDTAFGGSAFAAEGTFAVGQALAVTGVTVTEGDDWTKSAVFTVSRTLTAPD